MTALLLLLLLLPPTPEDDGPTLSHLSGFPSRSVAEQQERLYLRLADYHALSARYHPGSDLPRRWERESRWAADYWRLLAMAQDETFWDAIRLQWLLALGQFVGPQRYGRRWSPPLLTENVLPRPRREPDCPAR